MPGDAGTSGTAGHPSAGTSNGGNAGAGATTAGMGQAIMQPPGSPFHDLAPKPDVDTAPVANCDGKPDFTPCSTTTTPDRSYDICVGGTCVSPGCGDATCNAPSPHFMIPPAYGDDFFMRDSGAEPVVVDLVTGLGWQGCTAGTTGNDCKEGQGTLMDWASALAYCDALTWGGKDDFYLPDAYELFSLMDFTSDGTPINATYFPGNYQGFWTSHVDGSGQPFMLSLNSLDSHNDTLFASATGKDYVRCARRGFSRDAGYTGQRFESAGAFDSPTITDLATGLEWQGCMFGRTVDVNGECSGSAMKVAPADWQRTCDSLVWAGHDDWRLPSYKELQGLAQFPTMPGRLDPEIDASIFDIQAPLLAMSAAPEPATVHVLFDVETANKIGPTGTYPVMCVRWK